MPALGLEDQIADQRVFDRAVGRFQKAEIVLPTFAELAEPGCIPHRIRRALADVPPDQGHPLNLFRVHWHNGPGRTGQVPVPVYAELPGELTGVDARIVVAIGDLFPMIRSHKVLAAYGCLAPRVITGQFDPTANRAIWPSTGNYCRGGVAISRLMQFRGVAVLPEGMSRERFAWLEDWVTDPGDIIRTPGTESDVKEIYDKCAELSLDPANVIFNQFAEFANHYACTGPALARVFESLRASEPALRLRAFVSASGSAGTLGAGDHLKDAYGAAIVAVEALECPTMLYNGFGDHNIQGILAAVKTARYLGLGSQDVIMTVATDGASMYASERERVEARDYPAGFDEAAAAAAFGRWMLAAGTDHLLETSLRDRERIFNLGYSTWVEQQGVGLTDFTARRSQVYWVNLRERLASWDGLIKEFNARTGVIEDL